MLRYLSNTLSKVSCVTSRIFAVKITDETLLDVGTINFLGVSQHEARFRVELCSPGTNSPDAQPVPQTIKMFLDETRSGNMIHIFIWKQYYGKVYITAARLSTSVTCFNYGANNQPS
jgi:hypothetical protein